jgi:aarF domain-containing kinase
MRKAADTLSRLAPGLRVEQMVEQFTNNFEMQLNFEDEARNLRSFRSHFDSPFWSALVSYPRPIEGLVSPLVLVETFEEGESVATFLERKGALEEGKWRLAANGRWEMVGGTTLDEDSVIRQSISLCGVQALLKMCIWDNLIHADLHPGNVLIRMDEIGLIARLQRWLVLGDASSRVPHIVLLDAGLAASFNPAIFAHVRMFFDAVVDDDGEKYGEAILGLAESQPHVRSPEAFKQEVWQKNLRQKEEFNSGGGRAGQNIRDYLASVREHNVVIDPTVMVSLMSMMVLEGWQTRLDPAVCIFDCLQQARSSGAFGMAERVHLAYKHAYKATCGRLFSN